MDKQAVGGFWSDSERGKTMLDIISIIVTTVSIIVGIVGMYKAKKQIK